MFLEDVPYRLVDINDRAAQINVSFEMGVPPSPISPEDVTVQPRPAQ